MARRNDDLTVHGNFGFCLILHVIWSIPERKTKFWISRWFFSSRFHSHNVCYIIALLKQKQENALSPFFSLSKSPVVSRFRSNWKCHLPETVFKSHVSSEKRKNRPIKFDFKRSKHPLCSRFNTFMWLQMKKKRRIKRSLYRIG